MSDPCREQHPLLCDDISDDSFSPQFHRRLRPSSFKNRARNNLKGAAAIITQWPDHWSSFLTYWWIGLGMISLTTFIIYNSLFTFPMIQIANSKPISSVESNSIASTTHPTPLPREVYMHVFLEENEEIDLDKYVPYIEKITNQYKEFKYHLLIVYNDTNTKGFSDEQNNEVALNLLWDKDVTKNPMKKSNINIEYTSLSTYMDNSPLRKYWRTLPHQLIKFLARAISIWNKGGVAFNPDILTPRSSHSIYMEKLRKLLNKFPINHTENKLKTTKKSTKGGYHKQKFNNIRDIINALERNDDSMDIISHETLVEAEDKDIPVIMASGRSLFTAYEGDSTNKTTLTTDPINHSQIQPRTNMNLLENSARELISDNQNSTESMINLGNSNNSRKQSLLPLFFKYLFTNKGSSEIQLTEASPTNVSHRTRKSVIRINNNNNSLSTNGTEQKVGNTYEPIIISAKEINELAENIVGPFGYEIHNKFDSNRLTIDLKGNIIATDTPCHAFLGTIFSNAIHHNAEETVTDFIIAELSVFCKGLLSTCVGIDLILL